MRSDDSLQPVDDDGILSTGNDSHDDNGINTSQIYASSITSVKRQLVSASNRELDLVQVQNYTPCESPKSAVEE